MKKISSSRRRSLTLLVDKLVDYGFKIDSFDYNAIWIIRAYRSSLTSTVVGDIPLFCEWVFDDGNLFIRPKS